jgi:acetoin utilization protein AcuB
MLVSDVMTEDPTWVEETTTLGEAVIALLKTHARHLPVLRDGVVVGVLSDRDLRGSVPLLETLSDGSRGLLDRLAQPVAALMTREVVTLTPDRDLSDAVELMLEHGVGALPVVDSPSNRLVGIVSSVDVLRSVKSLIWG